MKIGKIITINDISVEIILSSNDIKIGDILEVEGNNKYVFEVVEINNISATCISLYSTRGLQKGSIVIKKNDGLEVEYSDKILGRVFDSYGDVIDGLPFESEKKVKVSHNTVSLKEVKVENELLKQGLVKKEMGREAFLEKVWEWSDEYRGHIREQLKKMGVSADFSREAFTMDENLNKAVRTVFVKLYNEGLISRKQNN